MHRIAKCIYKINVLFVLSRYNFADVSKETLIDTFCGYFTIC